MDFETKLSKESIESSFIYIFLILKNVDKDIALKLIFPNFTMSILRFQHLAFNNILIAPSIPYKKVCLILDLLNFE